MRGPKESNGIENMKKRRQNHAACLAWLLVLAGLGGGRAWAQTAPTNEQPPAVISVAEPDSEANTWAARAVQALRAGNPDAALPWIQRLMQAEPAALASTNGVTFRPARQVALELIRAIPERTLAVYRARMDLSKGAQHRLPAPTDPAALAARFQDPFASDRAETGLRLAGFYLDQGRFREAHQVLLDLLDSDATTRTPRAELLARLVVACARVGDAAGAERAWAELGKADDAARWAALETEVRTTPVAPAPISNAWTMAYGGPSRDGAPPDRGPEAGAEDGLVLRWSTNVAPDFLIVRMDIPPPGQVPPMFAMGRGSATARMTEQHLRPADDLIFAGNRAWINGFGALTLLDLDSGRVLQRTVHGGDPASPTNGWLGTAGEWLFSNRLNRAASRIGTSVFAIEDNYRSTLDESIRERQEWDGRLRRQVSHALPCGNVLAAYEADTGRLLWRIGREVTTPPVVVDDVVWNIPFVGDIVVDGKLDDWQGGGRELRLPFSGETGGMAPPDAEVELGWNASGMVVRASVTDYEVREQDDAANLFAADSIELFLADERGGRNSIQVVAGTGADPRYRQARMHLYDRRTAPPPSAAREPTAVVAGVIAPDGYTFEALLPWSNLGIEPRPGRQAGFQMYVNNTATNGPARAARFYPEGATFQDTGKMYTIRLVDSGIQTTRQVRVAQVVRPGRWSANGIRFLSAPVPCAGLAIVPVEDEGATLNVLGLEPDTGRTVWRTRVAYAPRSPLPRTSPATLTVDGISVYLCGGGGISVLNAVDGSVRWTSLYDPYIAGLNESRPEATWEESLALAAGGTVVALPEDSTEMFALDRRTGERLWTKPKPDGVHYVIGRQGDTAILAGMRSAVGLDLRDGTERWRAPLAGSTGRGILCGGLALIPNGRHILRLRIPDGADAGAVGAQTPDGLPLGNLYVRGDALLVAGLEQLYALEDAKPVFARLSAQLAREPTAERYAERGRLYAEVGRPGEALADLREAWKRRPGSAEEEAMRAPLLAEMDALSAQDTGAAKALYAAAAETGNRPVCLWRWAQYRELRGNTNGALRLYAEMLSVPDTFIGVAGAADREVSSRRMAARRIQLVLGESGERLRVFLEEPAARALARLGPEPALTALVECGTLYAGTASGAEALRQAARRAADRGDLGFAEAILYRALARAPDRPAVATDLLQLYARMKWAGGVKRLRDNWSWITAGAPAPDLAALAGTHAPAARPTGAMPLPPWRLRWRAKRPEGVQSTPSGLGFWERPNAQESALAVGCLSRDTGLPLWRRMTGVMQPWMEEPRANPWAERNLLPLNGVSGECVDLWSGAGITNNAIGAACAAGANLPVASLLGFGALMSPLGEGSLIGLDLLTGQTLWRRTGLNREFPAQATVAQTLSESGFVLLKQEADGTGMLIWLDPATGAFARQRFVGRADMSKWNEGGGSLPSPATDTAALGTPELAERRLTVQDAQTGTPIWTSPADLPIEWITVMPDGSVVALTEKQEFVLFDGRNGKILCRSDKARPAAALRVRTGADDANIYAQPSAAGPATIVVVTDPGTNEVVVLDPETARAEYYPNINGKAPFAPLGGTMPGLLLVQAYTNALVGGNQVNWNWLEVVNTRGENVNGWRLPRDQERSKVPSQYWPLFEEDIILMIDQGGAEILAYEHDPGDGEKK
jgi:outer membrane protein assembly factor BamB/predicted Zn-dependent protease